MRSWCTGGSWRTRPETPPHWAGRRSAPAPLVRPRHDRLHIERPAATSPSRHTGMRIAACTLGLAPVVLGVVLLFNPVKATNALALLLGIALVFGGLLELAVGWESRPWWGSVVVAGILVVGGLLAMVWPVSRCGRSPSSPGCPWWRTASAGSSSRWPRGTRPRGWPWLLLAGAFGVFSGVLALVWPA